MTLNVKKWSLEIPLWIAAATGVLMVIGLVVFSMGLTLAGIFGSGSLLTSSLVVVICLLAAASIVIGGFRCEFWIFDTYRIHNSMRELRPYGTGWYEAIPEGLRTNPDALKHLKRLVREMLWTHLLATSLVVLAALAFASQHGFSATSLWMTPFCLLAPIYCAMAPLHWHQLRNMRLV